MVNSVFRGHLFLADLGEPFGAEPGKVRPVVVVQSDLLNRATFSTTVVIPCTSKLRPQNIIRARLAPRIAGNSKECDVMIDQIRSIDTSRLLRELGTVPPIVMREIQMKLEHLLGLLPQRLTLR